MHPKFQAKLALQPYLTSANSSQKQSAFPATACLGAPRRGQSGTGFLLPDKGRQRGKTHIGVNAAVGVKNRCAQARKAKTAAALPVHRAADAALLARDHLLQPGQAVRGGVLAHFDADPAAAHLVRHGGRGAGAEEAVENQVAGVGCDMEDALEQCFGFRC